MMMMMNFHYTRFYLFLCISLLFSSVFFIFCDDPVDFGGISVLQDSMREYLSQDIAEDKLENRVGTRKTEGFLSTHKRAVPREIVRDVADRARDETIYTKYTWKRWLNMLYFSVSNTITMGYGDIYPISLKAKGLVITQITCLFAMICCL